MKLAYYKEKILKEVLQTVIWFRNVMWFRNVTDNIFYLFYFWLSIIINITYLEKYITYSKND